MWQPFNLGVTTDLRAVRKDDNRRFKLKAQRT